MLQQESSPAAPCPHCRPESPPVSYAGGSFCDDISLLARAFGLPFDCPTLVGVSHASRLICSTVGAFALASPRRPEPSWWLVRNGSASLGRKDPNRTFVERRRVAAGDWFDVTGALSTPARWAEDAVVHQPLELLALPHDSLIAACGSDRAFARALHEVLRRRLGEMPPAAAAVQAVLDRHAAHFGAAAASS